MSNRQIEELAKLFMDIGKLVLASLVLGFFQTNTDPNLVFPVSIFGLTISLGLFIMSLKLFKEI